MTSSTTSTRPGKQAPQNRSDTPPPEPPTMAAPWNESIKTPKIALIAADRLRRRIVSGELRPGDTLPPEAQLIAHFGISRPALREALRILEAESLISISRGIRGGATILKPTIEKVTQYGTFYLVANGTTRRDIHEARTLIEPSVVALLTSKSNKEAIAALRDSVSKGLAALAADNLTDALLTINGFHEHLVRFSDNRALGLLVGMLHEISAANAATFSDLGMDTETCHRMIGKALRAHKRLTELIEQGDAAEAERFWRGYMEKTAVALAGTGRENQVITLGQT